MNDHLTMDQLLALREPGAEPGTASARMHLLACPACRAEADRLEQRVARLKALPPLAPARDHWPVVQARLAAERRGRWLRRSAWGGLAAAAAVALVALAGRTRAGAAPDLATAAPAALEALPPSDLAVMKARSQALEASLEAYAPEQRVLDGRTALLADALQDRIARVDAQLQAAQLEGPDRGAQARDAYLLQLWQERVGLLDALVDVRVTRASNIGL